MPDAPSPAQQAASRANGARSRGPATAAGKARAARNGTRHGLRGGVFALARRGRGGAGPAAPGRRRRLAPARRLRAALGAPSWSPRCGASSACASWSSRPWRRPRQEHPPTEASLKRLLTFARYGARIDKELAQALRALRVLKARPAASLAESAACTREPEQRQSRAGAPAPDAAAHARTRAAGTGGGQPAPDPCHEAPEPPRAPPTRGPGAPGHARGRLERRRSPQVGPRPIGNRCRLK